MPSRKDDYWNDSRLLRKPIKALEVSLPITSHRYHSIIPIQFVFHRKNGKLCLVFFKSKASWSNTSTLSIILSMKTSKRSFRPTIKCFPMQIHAFISNTSTFESVSQMLRKDSTWALKAQLRMNVGCGTWHIQRPFTSTLNTREEHRELCEMNSY